jgi:hypothetical protein
VQVGSLLGAFRLIDCRLFPHFSCPQTMSSVATIAPTPVPAPAVAAAPAHATAPAVAAAAPVTPAAAVAAVLAAKPKTSFLTEAQKKFWADTGCLKLSAAEVWSADELKALLDAVNVMDNWPDKAGHWMKVRLISPHHRWPAAAAALTLWSFCVGCGAQYYEKVKSEAKNGEQPTETKVIQRIENFVQYNPPLAALLRGKLETIARSPFSLLLCLFFCIIPCIFRSALSLLTRVVCAMITVSCSGKLLCCTKRKSTTKCPVVLASSRIRTSAPGGGCTAKVSRCLLFGPREVCGVLCRVLSGTVRCFACVVVAQVSIFLHS